jgi:hypothetical protein
VTHTIRYQCFVEEFATIIDIETEDPKWQCTAQSIDRLDHERSSAHEQRYALGPSAGDVRQRQCVNEGTQPPQSAPDVPIR